MNAIGFNSARKYKSPKFQIQMRLLANMFMTDDQEQK